MKICIRADASLKMGTGHVMRCLTLAVALKRKSAQVEFICGEHEGNLIDFIQGKGFKVHALSRTENDIEMSRPSTFDAENVLEHSHWLGATPQHDADVCKVILKKIGPDWLVVDHYAIDETWQIELQGTYQKLMVIDDLADRRHQCDLLLDQTFGRQPQDYQKLVPENCQMLLGSQYALLRPEFAQWREYSLKRRENPELKKLLITMGGVDQNNVTGQVLDELRNCDLPLDLEITIIMGHTALHLELVQQQAKTLPYKIKVKSNVSNMAEIMANADFAIAAAGATTWERCCLGLPSIQILLAYNQKVIAEKIKMAGAALSLDVEHLGQMCEQLNNLNNRIREFSMNSAKIANGMGIIEVLRHLK
ncbi:UDP-2,4-diacetamido-2,4,6-trideoxy-beta-L-altropyranose hydrolase [Nitrosomonadales bacterium]|jgi:UDP-2,4-diacetamido-2,4,6-trideoxy-beta-L-altropyranose hydrolase|nr:UDP-2,4-diacetamido-2,4,6-trideoxy-beta-L-altropyranose hydrolase [Nitrosomonadales bacterium]